MLDYHLEKIQQIFARLQNLGVFLVNKSLYILLVTALLFASNTLAQKPKQALENPAAVSTKRADYAVPFVNKTLANGLEIIVLPDPSVPIVTVELAVRNGSFTESEEFHGLSHLYEHMFFKPNLALVLRECESGGQRPGLTVYPVCRAAFAAKGRIGDLSYLGDANKISIYNGTTREEIVNYYYTSTRDYLSTAIRFINDSVRFPSFESEDFENEKKVVIGEIDRIEANPFGYLDLEMKNRLFAKYPTRKDPQGTRASVGSATLEKMRTIQSRYYVPNNAALVVTGDAKPDEVFRLAEQIMGSWEKRAVDPFKEFPLVDHPPLTKNEAVIIDRPADTMTSDGGGENIFVSLGWHGPSIGKDDAATYAADVFSYIITQADSRFQRNLVDSGLASSAAFGYYTQRNVGPINLVITTTPAKAKQAITAAYKEIAAFTEPDYFTADELESAKTILENRDLFDREEGSEYAHTLGFWWSSTGIDYFRSYHAKLRAVTRADIDRYLKTYVQNKNHVAIALVTADGRKQAQLTEEVLLGGVK